MIKIVLKNFSTLKHFSVKTINLLLIQSHRLFTVDFSDGNAVLVTTDDCKMLRKKLLRRQKQTSSMTKIFFLAVSIIMIIRGSLHVSVTWTSVVWEFVKKMAWFMRRIDYHKQSHSCHKVTYSLDNAHFFDLMENTTAEIKNLCRTVTTILKIHGSGGDDKGECWSHFWILSPNLPLEYTKCEYRLSLKVMTFLWPTNWVKNIHIRKYCNWFYEFYWRKKIDGLSLNEK